MEHDENAITIYFCSKERREVGLVGHLSKDISKPLKQFLNADKNSLVTAAITEKRKREVGLVISCKLLLFLIKNCLKGKININLLILNLRVWKLLKRKMISN